MRKILSILMVLALMTALFVSCSQDNVGNAVTNDLVSVSFTTGGSRALTVSRETFDEDNYVWYYKAQKADSTGLTTGEQSNWTPVKPLTETPRTGLSGARIDGISQGLWDFELQAYAYSSQDPQDEDYPTDGVAVWNGKVTNQPVKKGEANIVNVTVSAIATGNGTINWSGISGMKDLGGVIKNFQEIIFVDPDAEQKVPTGMKVYISATAFGATEPVRYTTIDASNIGSVTGLFEDVEAGPYLFNAVVFSGTSVDAADFVYADETIAINVYSVLQTIIKGYISELSSYVEFGEPVANAVIEATTDSVMEVTTGYVDFDTDSTQSTSYQAASIPATAVVAIKGDIVDDLEGKTLTDLALALNVEDKGTTDASTTTTKNYEISLDAIVTTTDETSGLVSVESQSVDAIKETMDIALYIGKGLTIQDVKHNGTSMDEIPDESYEYNGSTGILTLHVKHFSPFSVIYEKEIAVARLIKADGTGSDYYSLQEAIDAAGNGDTVALLRSISDVSGITIKNRNVILDLAGKTITMQATKNIDVDASTVTITGNGIINVDPVRLGSAFRVHNDSTFSFLSGKLVVTNTTCSTDKVPAAYGIFLYDRETVNLGSKDTVGPTIECVGPCLATNGLCQGGTFNVYSGSYTSTRGSGDGDSNVIQIANRDVDGINTVNIFGGSFTQTGTPADGLSNIFDLRYSGKKIIHIEGGVFNCNGALFYDRHGISGREATDYVFTGAVAYMNGHVYNSLQTAIDAAPVTTESSILVLRDVADGSGLITEGTANAKYLTIDFGRHTYVVKGPAVGSKNTATQAMHWGDGSIITLKNGKIEVAEGAENVKMGMQNYSALTIEGMTIDVSKVPYSLYPNEEKYGDYANKPMPSFNTNRGSLTLKNSTVTVNSENEGYGCNVGNSSLQLYGSQIVGAGVVLDEVGAMVVTWDTVSTSSLTDHVNKYFPGDETHEICDDQEGDAHRWILASVNTGE